MLIQTPGIVMPLISFFHFSKRMVASAPKFLNMAEPHTIKSQTVFNFMALIYPTPDSVRLRLSSDINSASNKNGAMIAAANYLLYWHILHSWVKLTYIIACRGGSASAHALPSHIFVVSTEIDTTDDAVGKYGVVVAGWDEVDWVGEIHLLRNLFNSLTAKCTLVVASESVDLPFASQNYGMQCPTGNFENLRAEERIADDLSLTLSFLVLRFHLKLLDFG